MQSSTPYKTSRNPQRIFSHFPDLPFSSSLKVHRLPASLCAASLHTLYIQSSTAIYRRKCLHTRCIIRRVTHSFWNAQAERRPQHTALLQTCQSTPLNLAAL
jgi:hypothetical protein